MRQCKVKIFRPFLSGNKGVMKKEGRVSAIKILPNSQIAQKMDECSLTHAHQKNFATARMLGFLLKFFAVLQKHCVSWKQKLMLETYNVCCMAKLGNIGKSCTIPTINVSGNMLPRFVAVLPKLISQSSVPGSRVQVQGECNSCTRLELLCPSPPQDPTCRAYHYGCCPVLEVSARLLGANYVLIKKKFQLAENLQCKCSLLARQM